MTGSSYKKNYDGYTYYSSNPETINITTGTNVINLYYKAISGKEYTINNISVTAADGAEVFNNYELNNFSYCHIVI